MVNQWELLATVNGDGTSTTLSTGTITEKKFLQIQWFGENTDGIGFRFNGDSASNYAVRYSHNGDADVESPSRTDINLNYTTTNTTLTTYVNNIASEEKLVQGDDCERNTAGASNTPFRFLWAAKWTNTTDQIIQVDMIKSGANFTADSNLTVFGTD